MQENNIDKLYRDYAKKIHSYLFCLCKDNHIDSIDLFKMLHNLDEKTKELMYLRLTGFLSFKEIGEILGESEVWARVTFYRTKQKIVKEME